MVELEFSSRLGAPAAEVWGHATGMEGVNHELSPLMKMAVPRRARGLRIDDAPLATTAFRSPLLALGFIPIDLHRLQIDEVGPGLRFQERSDSLIQRLWEHERLVEPIDGGSCRLIDRLSFEARIAPASRLSLPLVRRLFEHRHRRLRALFAAPGRT